MNLYLKNIDYSDGDVVEHILKGEIQMFGIEVAFYALGFLTCLGLIAVVEEVNDKDKKNKKELRRKHREALKEQTIDDNRNEINIDVKVY